MRAAAEYLDESRPPTRERLASLTTMPLAEEVSAAYSRLPRQVRVSGAIHYFRPECNGIFDLLRMHNDRPLYRASTGAIVYLDCQWKLNQEPSTLGWSFVSNGAPWLVPPHGMWVPVDQASGEPVLDHVPSHSPQCQLPPLLLRGPPPQQLLVVGSDIPECNGAFLFPKTHNGHVGLHLPRTSWRLGRQAGRAGRVTRVLERHPRN